MKRIFPTVKLRPQTPPIDKREIGDAAIPRERKIHASLPPPLQLGPLATERAVSSDAVTLHILVGKICITFFPFSCEACSLYLVAIMTLRCFVTELFKNRTIVLIICGKESSPRGKTIVENTLVTCLCQSVPHCNQRTGGKLVRCCNVVPHTGRSPQQQCGNKLS